MRIYTGIGSGVVLCAVGMSLNQPWANVAGLVVIGLSTLLWGPRKSPAAVPAHPEAHLPAEPTPHALERLLPAVVPSWTDSLQQSRRLLADNVSGLLERFTDISQRLQASLDQSDDVLTSGGLGENLRQANERLQLVTEAFVAGMATAPIAPSPESAEPLASAEPAPSSAPATRTPT